MIDINIRVMISDQLQNIVDAVNGKKADIVIAISHVIIAIGVVFSMINFIRLSVNPIRDPMNTDIFIFLILLCLSTLYASQLGEYFRKPSIKIIQYSWLVFSLSVFSLGYISITFNSLFIEVLSKIRNIDVIPPDMLLGNIRVMTTLVPSAIILPVLYISLITLKDRKSKERIREFEFESLLPTVHKSDDTTIDIEIGKDYRTGLPLIVPEKILYEHSWLQGGSGSGKSSNYVLPFEEQLLRKKSYLNHQLKKISYDCLEKGIAYLNKPVSNMWLNENFNMSYIEPTSGREQEFYEAFEKYTIGIIQKDELIEDIDLNNEKQLLLDGLRSDDYKYIFKVMVTKNNMPYDAFEFEITKRSVTKAIPNPYLDISSKLVVEDNPDVKESIDGTEINYQLTEDVNNILVNIKHKEPMNNDTNKYINNGVNIDMINGTNEDVNNKANKDINNTTDKYVNNGVRDDYNYSIKVLLKGSGRIVPRNLGMTVVAPDGELISRTVEMGEKYGVKVHKIDPDISVIKKENIARFNPLRGDSPEKIGDIVASILVSMDIGDSSKANPYFTNASVRAIRNLVILLKIAFPRMNKGEPTLENVLFYLNNMNKTEELLKAIMDDYQLCQQWSTVIDYFRTNFLDPPKENNGTDQGSQKRETQRALGGIINQLDNLLGRREIREILCSEKNSLDLASVLRNGECIAISTRQGNLGPRLGKAFALFFILSLQNEVLSRYAENENPEIPHFLIIDEFPMYCNDNTETFFTFARKYKCSVTIAIQNMGQLKKVSDEFGETIFTNTSTKLLMSKSNLEDRKYWSDFFGSTTEMEYMTGIATSSVFADNPSYTEQMRGQMTEIRNITEEDVDSLKFQQMFYSFTNAKGRKSVGKATTDFLELKPEPYMTKMFDFEKYSMSVSEYKAQLAQQEESNKKKKLMEETNKMSNLSNLDKDNFEVLTDEIPVEENNPSSIEDALNKAVKTKHVYDDNIKPSSYIVSATYDINDAKLVIPKETTKQLNNQTNEEKTNSQKEETQNIFRISEEELRKKN